MPKWGMSLLIVSGLLASTTARSIAQFELKPASSSSQATSQYDAATSSSVNSKSTANPKNMTKQSSSTAQSFPQVGERTLSMTTGVLWLVVIGGVGIWQGGRRHAD
ncbi:hypothetical protein [Lacticaseibacillus manihotivorans]|jgi:hypothetical protein|uniref:Gram-positive cocci surface proteins LPxTG domain-containing protein n=2 Tax=Lacticaseibacillus manihotivorans TaxID=88233 RepID=A0A0R1R4L1_9LACO|nr:hypothetical protein [Lacticaseibacillus manihotivorans]KRL52320.1 hypothetical protein FD01_GL002573 [Lacticaseibacillus manihotivorans DSM 13343 = JCM 12514]QFQ90081.1 hypothetical protein LM010_00900 [Lacticaseibacillus manihotivorans]